MYFQLLGQREKESWLFKSCFFLMRGLVTIQPLNFIALTMAMVRWLSLVVSGGVTESVLHLNHIRI